MPSAPRIAALLAAVSLSSLALAAAEALPCADTASCLAAIRKAQAGVETLRADFVQTKQVQLLDEPLVSRGRFSFRRPDRMRLELEEPARATILIAGREIDVPGISQQDRAAMAGAPAAAMFAQLGAVFTGATDQLESGFEVEAAPVGAGAIEVVLVPKIEAWRSAFRRLQIEFAGPALSPRRIRLEDSLGDSLVVVLENVQRNVPLPESMFTRPTPAP
jgi:outer membrane lipoprotein-sorting protein